ncbi:hypothetical protein METBIDRAFT_31198 [Metschnikowia bicuspidata var. bicuspidata NRRL YB-4993]|uniref:Phox-like protein n=1 Tax=Metschnikowia bicuspidata var. bicuspidata NRRL YB-4993 TaxID=869754 RepID=A0A1A0HEE3_9ASCO|nr:hypothetical protein METBIDRAFT_31198 [Metschnikowia bicuspidata var. bicuspidata NRRL YB-4993]OBA22273.1 hypothetical protein METBIDRAFT_31198 [Metschnikowia bicuspidata var. bicuspidata NRRL YB-4993]
MSVISIPSYKDENGVAYYDINVRLPLRSITTSKRYSDFVSLQKSICAELGISQADFPYSLPPKSGIFANKHAVALERQATLAEFLERLIKDRDMQNSEILHEFLELPPKFKFTSDFFKDGNEDSNPDEKFLIIEDSQQISRMQWLTYLKAVRVVVESLENSGHLAAKLANREKATKYIRPNMEKLTEALQHMSQEDIISPLEFKQRTSMLSSLQSQMEQLVMDKPFASSPETNVKLSKRVFYQASNPPIETPKTLPLSNKALLQHQQQIHTDQDRELEALRKIIARQREIGETINKEVEEQMEILDSFSNEVDTSGDKIRSARERVKKIT